MPLLTSERMQGAKALVVGGSSGIGLAAAQAFARSGAAVTIASRSAERLAAAATEIGGNVETHILDTGDEAAIEAWLADGPVFDHVVVSAAGSKSGPLKKLSLADAYEAMNSKFWGAYRIARSVRIAETGSLTLVSGYLSVRPRPGAALQSALNAAVEALGRGLALELAPIRVNTVSPGFIDTPRHMSRPKDVRDQMYANVAASVPVKRVGQADDVAAAILYLASTPYATGSTVIVDGGGSIA